MSIFDNGTIYPWEYVATLLISAVIIWLGMRAAHRSNQRHAQRMATERLQQTADDSAARSAIMHSPDRKDAL